MIEIAIPGFRILRLAHLVLDYNGTLACDGRLIDGVGPLLDRLAPEMDIHVLTADTFGTACAELADLPCQVSILPTQDQAAGKLAYIERLGADQTVCIGNGRNDRLMLDAAALGVALLQEEGAAAEALLAADVVVPDIRAALNLLLQPRRLVATLRS